MSKNPSKPEAWSIFDVEQDPDGFLDAQRNAAEAAERAEAELAEADDKELFTREFVKAGGSKADAADAWKEKRNERAATTAAQAETSAEAQTRSRARSIL